MRVSFTVQTRAAPQGSKRSLGNGVMVESSKRVKPFRQDVRFAAMDQKLPEGWPMDAPMKASYRFMFRRPKSHLTGKGALRKGAQMEATSRGLGDIEKLARAASDALSNVLFNDDSQIVDMHISKSYAHCNMVVISLETIANSGIQ